MIEIIIVAKMDAGIFVPPIIRDRSLAGLVCIALYFLAQHAFPSGDTQDLAQLAVLLTFAVLHRQYFTRKALQSLVFFVGILVFRKIKRMKLSFTGAVDNPMMLSGEL